MVPFLVPFFFWRKTAVIFLLKRFLKNDLSDAGEVTCSREFSGWSENNSPRADRERKGWRIQQNYSIYKHVQKQYLTTHKSLFSGWNHKLSGFPLDIVRCHVIVAVFRLFFFQTWIRKGKPMGNHVHLFSEANHFPGIARGRRLVGRAMERISILWLLWCMLAGLLFMIGKASKVDMGRCSMAGWMVGTLTFLLVLQAAVVMAPSEDLANWAFLLLQFSSCPAGMIAEWLGLMEVLFDVVMILLALFLVSRGGKLPWKVLWLWLLSVAVTDYLPQTVELILAKNGEHHENHTVFPFGERLMKGHHFSNVQNASEWPESCQTIKEQDVVNNSTGGACYEWCREQLGYGKFWIHLYGPPDRRNSRQCRLCCPILPLCRSCFQLFQTTHQRRKRTTLRLTAGTFVRKCLFGRHLPQQCPVWGYPSLPSSQPWPMEWPANPHGCGKWLAVAMGKRSLPMPCSRKSSWRKVCGKD